MFVAILLNYVNSNSPKFSMYLGQVLLEEKPENLLYRQKDFKELERGGKEVHKKEIVENGGKYMDRASRQ